MPEDPGGLTKYGIATNYALKEAKDREIVPKDLNVKDLTWGQAVTIYKELYWKPIKGNEIAEIDPRLATVLFDTKVNSKKGIWDKYAEILGFNNWDINEAIKVFKKMDVEERNKIINDFINARLELYKRNRYEKGYKNRVNKLKKFINDMDNFCDNSSSCSPNGSNKLIQSTYAEKVRRNVQAGSQRIDPLVIDLDGDGIELVNINRSDAMFDLTGSGFANKVGWVSGGDAFLVWDRNNDNRVNDIFEMFGGLNQSGFKALSLYDTNRDGRIDAFDDVFKNLKLWQDKNGDGRTDEGELLSLSDVGIKSINLNTTQTNINQEGNIITEIGSVEFEDGKTTQAGNVNFELERLYSYYNREVELNPEIVELPWVRGYGFMPDLPIAMSLDNTLLQMVKDAVAKTDLTKFKEEFEKIIFRWAGVENVEREDLFGSNIRFGIRLDDKQNRMLHFNDGTVLKYEQIGAVLKFTGTTKEDISGNAVIGQSFLEAWNTMFQGLFTRFIVDAGLLEDVLPAYYDFFTDKIIIDEEFDVKEYESQIKQMLNSHDLNQINLAFISMMVLK